MHFTRRKNTLIYYYTTYTITITTTTNTITNTANTINTAADTIYTNTALLILLL